MKEIDILEILKKILEIMQTFDDYISYKFMLFLVFMSSALLISLQIENVSIILSNMNIEVIAIILLIIGVSGIAYKIFVGMMEYALRKCRDIMKSKGEEKERIARTAQMREILHSLTTGEARILKYMIRTGGVKWLPIENVSVLGLMDKGLLKALTNISILRARNYYRSAQCVSYALSGIMQDYIKRDGEYLRKEWVGLPEADNMDIYQEDEEY